MPVVLCVLGIFGVRLQAVLNDLASNTRKHTKKVTVAFGSLTHSTVSGTPRTLSVVLGVAVLMEHFANRMPEKTSKIPFDSQQQVSNDC